MHLPRKQKRRHQTVNSYFSLIFLCLNIFLNIVILLPKPCESRSNSQNRYSSPSRKRNLYETLDLPKDCTDADIKKAYRKKALKYHPDKINGSDIERSKAEEEFKSIGEAYEVLSEKEKRKMYDQHGESALDPNFNPAFGGMGDNRSSRAGNFNFGDTSGHGGFFKQNSQRGAGGIHDMDINELLAGLMGAQKPNTFFEKKSFSNSNSRQSFSARDDTHTTRQSKSYEQKFYCSLEELASGCVKKLKVSSPARDKNFGNEATYSKIYSLNVKQGWKQGTRISFGASNDGKFPKMTFVLTEKKHKHFERRGNDLVWQCSITPNQAKEGQNLKVPLLDGDFFNFSTLDKVPIQQGHVMRLKGKGILAKGGYEKGDLIIEFHIKEKSGK